MDLCCNENNNVIQISDSEDNVNGPPPSSPTISIGSNGYIEKPIENVMKNMFGHFTEMVTDIENLVKHIQDVDETDVNVSTEMASFTGKAACKIRNIEAFVKEMYFDKHYDLGNGEILRDDFLNYLKN